MTFGNKMQLSHAEGVSFADRAACSVRLLLGARRLAHHRHELGDPAELLEMPHAQFVGHHLSAHLGLAFELLAPLPAIALTLGRVVLVQLDGASALRQYQTAHMIYRDLELAWLRSLFADCADSPDPLFPNLRFDDPEMGFPEGTLVGDTQARVAVCNHLAHHPHLLMPLGFDEARVIGSDAGSAVTQDLREFSIKPFANGVGQELLLRDARSGEWWALEFIHGSDRRGATTAQRRADGGVTGRLRVTLRGRDGNRIEVSALDILRTLGGEVRQPAAVQRSMVAPRAARLGLTEPANASAGLRLTESLLQSLFRNARSLTSLTPGEFEDVVAELARDVGLDVTQTKRTRDGGRDIIVDGEFFPGVRARMAIEVTTQPKVGVAKSAKALHQNRHFPLIMLVTCGRFSAGVVQEHQTPEFAQRLFLADQQSVLEWINRYGSKRGWIA